MMISVYISCTKDGGRHAFHQGTRGLSRSTCSHTEHVRQGAALTRSELSDSAQQVIVDDRRSVFALAPAHRRRGRWRDEKLFDGLRRRQIRLVDVLIAVLDLLERTWRLISDPCETAGKVPALFVDAIVSRASKTNVESSNVWFQLVHLKRFRLWELLIGLVTMSTCGFCQSSKILNPLTSNYRRCWRGHNWGRICRKRAIRLTPLR